MDGQTNRQRDGQRDVKGIDRGNRGIDGQIEERVDGPTDLFPE